MLPGGDTGDQTNDTYSQIRQATVHPNVPRDVLDPDVSVSMLASDQAAEEGTYQSFTIGVVHNSTPGRVDRDSSYAVRSDTLSHPVERGFRSLDGGIGATDEVDNSTPGRVCRLHPVVRDSRFVDLGTGATDEDDKSTPDHVCRDSSYADRTDASSHPVARVSRSLNLVTGAIDEVDISTPVRVRKNSSCVERSDTLSHPVMRGFPSLDLVTGATDEGMVLDGLRPVGDRPTVEEVAPSVDVVLGAHSTDTGVLGDSYTVAESLFSTDEGVLMAGSPTVDDRPFVPNVDTHCVPTPVASNPDVSVSVPASDQTAEQGLLPAATPVDTTVPEAGRVTVHLSTPGDGVPASDQAAEEGVYQSSPIDTVVRDFRSLDLMTGATDEVDNSTPGRARRNRSRVECSDTLSHPVVHDFRFPDLVPGATDESMVLVGSLPVVDRPTVEDVAPSVVVVSGAHSTDTGVLGNSYPAAESLRTSNVSDVLVPAATDEGVLMAGLPTAVVRPTPVDDAAIGDNTESGDPSTVTDSPAHPPPSDQAGEDDKPLDDKSTPADDGSSKVGQATVTPVGVHRNRLNRSAERSLNRMLRPRSPVDMVSAHSERRGARPTLMSSRSSARPGDNPGTIRDSIRALAGNARSAAESIARLLAPPRQRPRDSEQ